MYLFMISLLLFSNIITCYEEIPSRRMNAETVKSDDENCVCFPGGESLIPELSNLKTNGLERLVVYLYKNENTNEVYVFQPSAEKQPLIPDIPYTSGDLLKPVTTETIVSLFSNNSNNPQTHQPIDITGEPIGLNIGIVNHVSNPRWPITGLPVKSDRNIHNRNNFSNKEYVVSSMSPDLDLLKKSHFEPISIKHNIIRPLIKPLESTDYDDTSLQTDVIVDSHPGKETGPNKEEKYIIPLNPYQNKDHHINDNIHEAEANLPKRLSTFDDWFKEQMVTVQNQKISEGVDKIDSDGLRSLVLKTLLDNHFHLGAKGMMIDDDGTPIDLNNLELRPILIGNAVKFQSLELTPQITFPETLPYLQGILIILIHPFKMLGVIPVGKTYVSSSGKVKTPSLKHVETYNQKLSKKIVLNSLKPGNSNPHLTNTNAQNINALPINSHIGVTSNSFWNHFYSKNPLLKPDSSSHHFIHAPITRISESPFESGRSNVKLIVNPLSEDLGSSASREYSPGFNSKYFTDRPDIVDSNTWGSYSNSGSGYSNGNPNTQHLHHQESSWASDGWGDVIMKSIPSVLNSEVTGIEIPNWINLDDNQNHPRAEDDTLLGPTRRFSSPLFKGVLKTLIGMLLENLVNKKNPEDKSGKEDDGTERSAVNVNTTVSKPNALRQAGNDDGPDYRIIGGSAVTGSGSPLSNKGRSGSSII